MASYKLYAAFVFAIIILPSLAIADQADYLLIIGQHSKNGFSISNAEQRVLESNDFKTFSAGNYELKLLDGSTEVAKNYFEINENEERETIGENNYGTYKADTQSFSVVLPINSG